MTDVRLWLEQTGRANDGRRLELIFHGIFHPIGWAMPKALTLGRYPPRKPADCNRELVAAFPLLILLVAVAITFP